MPAESIQAMRERRNALVKETRNLLDNNPGASWNDDHQKKYDDTMADVERVDASIQRTQRVMDAEAEDTFKAIGGRVQGEGDDGDGSDGADRAKKIYGSWLRGGDRAVTAEDWAHIQATMSGNPAVNPEQGGYTVPTDVASTVLEALKAFGGMREVSTILRTAAGNPLSYPTTDGTSEEGEIVPEGQEAADADISFGTKGMGAYKFSSKVVTVPIELLQDSAINVEALVSGRLQMRLGRTTNRLYTVGSGAAQPTGIVTAAPLGKAGAVSAVPLLTYDDLVDLEHSVDPAYRDVARFMFHDQALAMIRKIKDSDGRPIYVPALSDGSVGGAPARLNNRGITINQHMAPPAPAAKSILFGDFTKYVIRDVMALTLFRFTDSAYAKKGQVGFLAFMRSDGNLMDVGGAVKHFKHGAAA